MSEIRTNPHLAALPVYVPGRPIEEVAREHGLDPSAVIKLASNENPFGPSPKAVEAVRRAVAQMHLYPDGSAFRLKRRLAEKLGLESAQVLLGNGSNEILELVGHAFLQPGDEVLASEYCFAVYPIVSSLFGARLVLAPAREFGADVGAMLSRVTERTRVIFLANPNNPTGTLTSSADVARLLSEAPRTALIVMDEAYVEFLDKPFDSLRLLQEGSQRNLVVVRTFSKVYGLAGLRVGYGAAPSDLIATMERARQPFNLNALAQEAALAALDDTGHLALTIANNRAGLEFFHAAFGRLGLPFVPSAANFVLARVGDGKGVFERLQRRGVITRPMASYGLPEWIRFSVGRPEENQRCVQLLGEILGAGR